MEINQKLQRFVGDVLNHCTRLHDADQWTKEIETGNNGIINGIREGTEETLTDNFLTTELVISCTDLQIQQTHHESTLNLKMKPSESASVFILFFSFFTKDPKILTKAWAKVTFERKVAAFSHNLEPKEVNNELRVQRHKENSQGESTIFLDTLFCQDDDSLEEWILPLHQCNRNI